jgi:hypothetical protein
MDAGIPLAVRLMNQARDIMPERFSRELGLDPLCDFYRPRQVPLPELKPHQRLKWTSVVRRAFEKLLQLLNGFLRPVGLRTKLGQLQPPLDIIRLGLHSLYESKQLRLRYLLTTLRPRQFDERDLQNPQGFAQGTPTLHLAKELDIDRKHLLERRHKIQQFLAQACHRDLGRGSR